MEIRELKSFIIAAKYKSISKAAENLGVGQPTVTSHIKRLETSLGIILFDRVKRPIKLTLSGEKLLDLASPLVDGIDSLSKSTKNAENNGPIHIASTPDIVPHTLLRVLKTFLTENPNVQFRINSAPREDVIKMVQDGEVEIGVSPPPRRATNLKFEGLFVFERVLLAPLNHPIASESLISLEQLAPWPLILTKRNTHTRQMLEEGFKIRGLNYDVILELDSMEVIKRYVSLGMGISVGPRLAIEPEDEKIVSIISMSNILPVEQVGVITLNGKEISSPANKFIKVMKKTLSVSNSSIQ
tara:strand:+ start:13919 stop:14815 length:897 start_codon:yes stop_codon:yes gene_type:complete